MPTPDIRPLNSELELIAQTELHENPKQIQEHLDIIRKWLEKSSHLKTRTDDQFLVAFLRGCKYSLEVTKQKIEKYYTYRTDLVELVGDRDPLHAKLHEIIKLGTTLPLPITGSDESPRLILVRMSTYNPSNVMVENVLKVFTMINDVLLNDDDNTIVAGQIIVADFGNVTMGHILQMQPALLKKSMMLIQESSPIRIKGIHYINAPKSFERIFNIIKSFLSEKLKNRVSMHSSLDSFYSIVPRKMMPIEYEGEAGSLQSLVDEWEKKLLSYRDYFLDDNKKYGVDEKKRIGAAQNPLLGLEGSFKQLQFD